MLINLHANLIFESRIFSLSHFKDGCRSNFRPSIFADGKSCAEHLRHNGGENYIRNDEIKRIQNI